MHKSGVRLGCEAGSVISWKKTSEESKNYGTSGITDMKYLNPLISTAYSGLKDFIKNNNAGLGIRANPYNVHAWSAWTGFGVGTTLGVVLGTIRGLGRGAGIFLGEEDRKTRDHYCWKTTLY